VTVEKIGGRAAVRKVASFSLDKAGGRCVVEEIAGAVKVEKIGGDCLVKGAPEAVVSKAGGDVDILCLTLAGSIAAGGDIHLSLDSVADSASLKAGGDIYLYLPGGAQVNLDIISNNEDIRIKLGDLNLNIEEETYFHTMGEGLPVLKLIAGGDVLVSDEEWTPRASGESFDANEIGIDWDFSDIGDEISRKVEAAVAGSTRFVDIGARMSEKAARKTEAAARKAERRIEKMMRKMNIEDRSQRGDWTPPAPPAPPAWAQPASSGISEEERMAVLQMLQEKKITLEEAERLLDALDSSSE
jgi:hypothetical protein